ncbi:hypothetical protein CFC21_045457 [Triticum aestivum]|uniref:F-box domain-containing protein n=2 Tax=Triticum aestivum TaxID=4565 RepID=A0A9R1FSE9_WHEAT|nr:hypothetical protein CFC21_045457 [Triticum aestivum]
MADAILDDLLLDIFALLADPVDLLRCAGTCRRWLRLLGNDRAILRRAALLPENENARHASFVLGAFYQNSFLVKAPVALEKTSRFPPQFRRIHATWRRLSMGSTSIIPNADGLFNHAKPLASRGGLLLVRLLPAPLDFGKLHLAVCHPLVGDVHVLPPPAVDLDHDRLGGDVTGYALLTRADHHGHGPATAFRVLFTAKTPSDQLVHAYAYSSASRRWSAPIDCPDVGGLTMSGPPDGVVDGRGTVHWLYTDHACYYTLDVSADAARVSLTKLPIPVSSGWEGPPFLCTAGRGKALSFVNSIDYGRMLELWTKREQDDDDDDDHGEESFEGWLRCMLTTPQGQGPEASEYFGILGFAESRGAILVHRDVGFLCLDLESTELEKIRGRESSSSGVDWYPGELSLRSWCTYNHVVFYDMDWSSYILHLLYGSLGGTTMK